MKRQRLVRVLLALAATAAAVALMTPAFANSLLLDATTKSLEMATSSAASTDYVVSYADHTTTAFTPGMNQGNVASATTTTILAAPAASTQRQVKWVSVINRSTSTAQTVTLKLDVSGTEYYIGPSSTLAPGEALRMEADGSLTLFNAAGVKRTQAVDISGYGGRIYTYQKAGTAKDAAGYWIAYAKDAGHPGAYSLGSPGLNGTATDCSTTGGTGTAEDLGAHVLPDPASGSYYLTKATLTESVAEFSELIDVLWYNTGLAVTTTTGQNLTPAALPARDIDGSTNGEGVYAALLTTTANTNAGVITKGTIYMTSSNPRPHRASSFAPVSSRPSSSASVDRPGRHRLSGRARLAPVAFSCGQLLVGDAAANDSIHERIQPVQGVPGHIAGVQPERELVHVAVEVLAAGVVVDAVKAALQDGPDALDAVGMGRAPDVLLGRVVDRLVTEEKAVQVGVSGVLVGVEVRPDFHGRMDNALEGVGRAVGDGEGERPAATLAQPDDSDLAYATPASMEPLVLVLVGFLATDKALVHFHVPAEFAAARQWIRAACLTEPLEHEPRRLLSDADLLRHLKGRNALAGRHQQIHGVDPLVKRDVRPLENGPGSDGERVVVGAGVAAIEAALANRDPLARLALRTDRAGRPEAALQVQAGRLGVGETLEDLERTDRATAHSVPPRRHRCVLIATNSDAGAPMLTNPKERQDCHNEAGMHHKGDTIPSETASTRPRGHPRKRADLDAHTSPGAMTAASPRPASSFNHPRLTEHGLNILRCRSAVDDRYVRVLLARERVVVERDQQLGHMRRGGDQAPSFLPPQNVLVALLLKDPPKIAPACADVRRHSVDALAGSHFDVGTTRVVPVMTQSRAECPKRERQWLARQFSLHLDRPFGHDHNRWHLHLVGRGPSPALHVILRTERLDDRESCIIALADALRPHPAEARQDGSEIALAHQFKRRFLGRCQCLAHLSLHEPNIHHSPGDVKYIIPITNTTITYTDSEGNTGNTGTFQGVVGWQAPATPVIGTWMPFQLAAGDRGVRSVQTVTLGTSYGAGALPLVLFRPLASISNTAANVGGILSSPQFFTAPGIRIYNDTCVWAISVGSASAANISGTYTIMER